MTATDGEKREESKHEIKNTKQLQKTPKTIKKQQKTHTIKQIKKIHHRSQRSAIAVHQQQVTRDTYI